MKMDHIKFKFLLALVVSLQGCTVLDAVIDRELSTKKRPSKIDSSFEENSGEFKWGLAKHLLDIEPLPAKKKPNKCGDLTGTRKAHCLNTVKQLNESLKKHAKP